MMEPPERKGRLDQTSGEGINTVTVDSDIEASKDQRHEDETAPKSYLQGIALNPRTKATTGTTLNPRTPTSLVTQQEQSLEHSSAAPRAEICKQKTIPPT